jgi:hypothetical protein
MGSVTINGKHYQGSNIVVNNDEVIIDGKRINDKDLPDTILHVEVTGGLVSLQSDASVNCKDVKGDVTSAGSVSADNIGGNVDARGSVNCDDIKGSVNAGGSINCDDIGGSVRARGSINRS